MNTQTDTQRIQHLERLVDSATGVISGFAHALSCKPDGESVLQAINDLKTRNRDLVSERNAAIAAERTWETTMMRVCGEDGPGSVADKFKTLVTENVGLHETVEAVRGVANNSSGISGWHLNGEIAKWEEILPEIDDIETPATDAAIAAIRAEGVEIVREHPAIKLCCLTHVCDEIAAQLREGAQS